MAGELSIPTVTWEQIEAFRQLHFAPGGQGDTFFLNFIPPPQPISTPNDVAQNGYHAGNSIAQSQGADVVIEEEEEEDDLGYYPDGVKRTLTDAQIAIFRHSEIQEMLKAKHKQLEAKAISSLQAYSAPASPISSDEDATSKTPPHPTEVYLTHDPHKHLTMTDTTSSSLPWDDADVGEWQQGQGDAEEGEVFEEDVATPTPPPAKKQKTSAVKATYDAPSGMQFLWPAIEK